MDSRIAILGANGAGKSTLLHLIMGHLQPTEGTISKHAALKLAKYSQHSADQLPYDKSPIEYFQGLFAQKYPEKDVMVRMIVASLRSQLNDYRSEYLGMARPAGKVRSLGFSPNVPHQTSIRRPEEPVRAPYTLFLNFHPSSGPSATPTYCFPFSSVVFAQLSMEHPHILLLGRPVFFFFLHFFFPTQIDVIHSFLSVYPSPSCR